MSKIRAFIVGGDSSVARLLTSDSLFEVIDGGPMPDPSNFDMVVFTGGEDVLPEFYGEENRKSSWVNRHRDLIELNIFQKTKDTHYHFGICRGLQLLAICNGSTLWQDVTGHSALGTHRMTLTSFDSVRQYKNLKEIVGVTSVHHQAIKVTQDNINCILAYEDFGQPVTAIDGTGKPTALDRVVEAAWFEATRSFGVQGHPEYKHASKEFKDYVLYKLIEDKDTGYYANQRRGHA